MIRLALSVVLISFLASCASTVQYVPLPDQDKVVEDPSKGRIYVMRPSSFGGSISMRVSVEGQGPIGRTGPGGFLCWESAPGTVTVVGVAENTAKLPVEVVAGSVTYVHQGIRFGWIMARNSLAQLDAEKGKAELADCDPPEVKIPEAKSPEAKSPE